MIVMNHGKCFHTIKCKKCNCEVGFADLEIKNTCSYNRSLPYYDYDKEYIECPECGNEILIKLVVDGRIVENNL